MRVVLAALKHDGDESRFRKAYNLCFIKMSERNVRSKKKQRRQRKRKNECTLVVSTLARVRALCGKTSGKSRPNSSARITRSFTSRAFSFVFYFPRVTQDFDRTMVRRVGDGVPTPRTSSDFLQEVWEMPVLGSARRRASLVSDEMDARVMFASRRWTKGGCTRSRA